VCHVHEQRGCGRGDHELHANVPPTPAPRRFVCAAVRLPVAAHLYHLRRLHRGKSVISETSLPTRRHAPRQAPARGPAAADQHIPVGALHPWSGRGNCHPECCACRVGESQEMWLSRLDKACLLGSCSGSPAELLKICGHGGKCEDMSARPLPRASFLFHLSRNVEKLGRDVTAGKVPTRPRFYWSPIGRSNRTPSPYLIKRRNLGKGGWQRRQHTAAQHSTAVTYDNTYHISHDGGGGASGILRGPSRRRSRVQRGGGRACPGLPAASSTRGFGPSLLESPRITTMTRRAICQWQALSGGGRGPHVAPRRRRAAPHVPRRRRVPPRHAGSGGRRVG